ncbi:uncharacterized protein LOC143257880 [Tachypleus tridentatus]|uniref:uncharacterized protein LOC143257880 n=1 Tax=Tachypleus tridentatus TaxID=6853 RepID=UPI003FD1D8C0
MYNTDCFVSSRDRRNSNMNNADCPVSSRDRRNSNMYNTGCPVSSRDRRKSNMNNADCPVSSRDRRNSNMYNTGCPVSLPDRKNSNMYNAGCSVSVIMFTSQKLHTSLLPVDKTASPTAWTYQRGERPTNDRIWSERSTRSSTSKMAWRSSEWTKSFLRREDGCISDPKVDPGINNLNVRKFFFLYDYRRYKQAAIFICRLGHSTIKAILKDLPMQMLMEDIPHSFPILEALYARMFLSDQLRCSMNLLQPSRTVMKMIHLLAQHNEESPSSRPGPHTIGYHLHSCKKLLKIIVRLDPHIKKQLYSRRRALNRAIEGLGNHGVVETSNNALMGLFDALKVEFQRTIHQYKIIVQKLNVFSLDPKESKSCSLSYGPAPTKSSHQRLLSLRQDEIQERLIKNKTFLDIVEPILSNQLLIHLLSVLQKRVEFDKDVLFQFNQLKKEVKDINPNVIVAPVLMKFSQSYQKIIELINKVNEEDTDSSSDISGYHSDSDSALAIMSGNSPFSRRSSREILSRPGDLIVGEQVLSFIDGLRELLRTYLTICSNVILHLTKRKTRQDLFLVVINKMCSCSIECTTKQTNYVFVSEEKLSSCHKTQKSNDKEKFSNGTYSCNKSENSSGKVNKGAILDDETGDDLLQMKALKQEIDFLQTELKKAKKTIAVMQERETLLTDRLAQQAQKMLERGVKFENVSLGDKRPTALIRRYGNLYAQARVDALDSLENLPELQYADELKSKILFSVVVLAFSSVQNTITAIKNKVRNTLHIPQVVMRDLNSEIAIKEVEASVDLYLKATVNTFNIDPNVEEVCSQIWATLYDYPCLKTCEGLLQYVRDTARLAWGLATQTPPFVIDYQTRTFNSNLHVRFHSSNQDSDQIKTYLWPSLLEGTNGPCVHRGVVITG